MHPAGSDEQQQVLLQVIATLDQLGIRYCVGGSVASNAFGLFRATQDADIVAVIRPELAEALFNAFQASFYVDLESVRAAAISRSSFNLIHLETLLKVDVFVAKQDPFHVAQFRRRVQRSLGAENKDPVWLTSPEDTILAKLDWFRLGGGVSDRQWGDVTGVMKVQAERLDLAYLREMAAELKVCDLLERALQDSGLA